MTSMKFIFLLLLFSCTQELSSSSPLDKGSSSYTWNLTGTNSNLSIQGYDAVSYFSLNKNDNAIKGSPKFSYKWEGAVWYFSSAANLETFKSNPKKYIPQYGGYCAYAAARNYLYRIDPNAWTIKNSKLYLNASKGLRSTWIQNIDNEISKADKNWSNLQNKGLKDIF